MEVLTNSVGSSSAQGIRCRWTREVIWKCFGSETERPVEGGQVEAFDRSDPAHLGLSRGAGGRGKNAIGSNAGIAVQVGGQISHSVLSVRSGASAVAEWEGNGTRAKKAGCGAPLWPCSGERDTGRYSPAFHAELAARARVRTREVFPCSERKPTICVRQRLAAVACQRCSADSSNLTLRRRRPVCPMASARKIRLQGCPGPAGIQRTAGGAAIGERRGTLWRPAGLTRRRTVSAAMRLCGGMGMTVE
ncbi:hypothetical protein PSPO01_09302 [Paraphaeosphaeria sporulosa]